MDLFSVLDCIHSTFLALESLQRTTKDSHALKPFDPTPVTKPELHDDPAQPTSPINATSTKKLKKHVTFEKDTFHLIPTRDEIFGTAPKSTIWYNSNDIAEFEKAAVTEVRHFMANNALNDFHIATMLYFGVKTEKKL